MLRFRAAILVLALPALAFTGCEIHRVNGPPLGRTLPAALSSRELPGAPIEGRGQLLLLSKADPAAERFLLDHITRPFKVFSTPTAVSLTEMAVIATGHAEAQSLVPDAKTYEAQLAEGERAELVLAPPPGCLTVIVHGGLGVMEVDSFVVDGPGEAPRILGQDDRAGPAAVLGGRNTCLRLDSPEARIIAIVRRGAGRVVMGVFRGAQRS